MARTSSLNEFLTDVAESIRTKKGTTDLISPSNFDTEIAGIETGGSTPEKGIIINEYDSDGYPTDIEIVGLTEIPKYFLDLGGKNRNNFFSRAVNIKLPEGLNKIGTHAFQYGTFTNINLPDTITEIGQNAFAYNTNVVITKLPDNLKTTNSYNFTGCTNFKIKELPRTLKSISTYAFQSTGIEELTLHEDFTSLDNSCLSNCSNLVKLIVLRTTPPSCPSGGFTPFNKTPIADGTGFIYVPDESVETYKAASGWSTYASQIKGISELESA